MINCVWCGDSFNPDDTLYTHECSEHCHRMNLGTATEEDLAFEEMRECIECGTYFPISEEIKGYKPFCSRECGDSKVELTYKSFRDPQSIHNLSTEVIS